jgi:hypothetical protein
MPNVVLDEYGFVDTPEWEAPPGPVRAEDDPWFPLIDDAADIAVEKLPPVVEVVEGIVAEQSKLVIGGGSKSFKTWITIFLAICISHGIPFLERKTTRLRVLYVNLELKAQTFKRRLQTIAKATGITVDPKWLLHLPLRGKMAGVPLKDLISRIVLLAQYLKASVIVLDPVYKMNTEGDENSSRDQTVFFNQLDRLTTEAECTVVLNDHFGKGNQSEKDPLDAIRGSSAKGGDVDAAMILRKHEIDGCYRVDLIHRELPPVDPFCIGWEFPLMVLRQDLSPDAMKKAKAGRRKAHDPKRLLAAIMDSSAEEPVSIAAWAKSAGLPRQTLADYLPELRSRGWIQTAGEGSTARQFLTKEGREAARSSMGEV